MSTICHKRAVRASATLLLLPVLGTLGCMVKTHKDSANKDVDIATPLGGLSVHTNGGSTMDRLGLPLYPGAVAEKKSGADDTHNADVNLNFGGFHLRVLAADYTTPDAPAKVREYYRKALSQYSDVIECKDKKPLGTPTRTGLGLTCSDDNHVHSGTVVESSGETELKAGSPSRQHIVTIATKDGSTHFGMVSLELPRKGDGDKSDGDGDKHGS